MRHVTHYVSAKANKNSIQYTIYCFCGLIFTSADQPISLHIINKKRMSDFYCSEASIFIEENRCFFRKNKEGNSTATDTLEELMNVRVGYHLPTANANTQTTNEDFFLLGSIREASTQTVEKDIKFLERTQEASTQTTEEDFIYLESTQETCTQTTDEDFILLEPTRHTSTQTNDKDVIIFKPIRYERTLSSVENSSSIKASHINNIPKTSADTNETISITWIKYNSGCCIGNVNLSNFLSRREVPNIVNAPRFQKIPNGIQKANKVPKINKNRNVPNLQRITMKAPVVKRSKCKIHRTSNPVLSRKNVQGGMNYIHSKASQKPPDDNFLVEIHQNSLTSVQEDRQLKTIGNLTGSILKTIPHFEKDALNEIIPQTHQNKYAPSKVSYSKWSAKATDSVINTSEVANLSCFYENKEISNIRENKFQSKFPFVDKPGSTEQKKQSLCWICKATYADHELGNDLYKCYICRYISNRKRDTQFHSCIQRLEQFCFKTREEVFTENDLQGTELTCGLCFEVFQSKGRLEKHALVHEDYNLSHCTICKWKLSAHVVEYRGKRRYQCCGCSYRTNHTKYLQQHLNTHIGLQIFRCYECDSSFSEKKSLERHFKNTHKRPYE